jgi:transcriptional regulator with XRE-family HTH domain
MARARTQQQHNQHYVGQKTFGSFLKRERARHGFSRHSLAITTGIQERVLAEIELNRCAPSYGHLKILAAVLEIPEQDLLEAAGCIERAPRD